MKKTDLEAIIARLDAQNSALVSELSAIKASLRESVDVATLPSVQTVTALVEPFAPSTNGAAQDGPPERPVLLTKETAPHLSRGQRKAANKANFAAWSAAMRAYNAAHKATAPKAAKPAKAPKAQENVAALVSAASATDDAAAEAARKAANADLTVASVTVDTIVYIAESCTGGKLASAPGRFRNAANGAGRVYEGYAIGDIVNVHLNAVGRIVKLDKLVGAAPSGTSSAAPVKTSTSKAKAGKATASAAPIPAADAVITKISKDGTRCLIKGMFGWQPVPAEFDCRQDAPEAPKHPNAKRAKEGFRADGADANTSNDPCDLCGGPRHFKGSAEQVSQECAERQWVNMGHPAPTMTDMATMIPFMWWLETTSVATFAHTKAGIRWIGKPRNEISNQTLNGGQSSPAPSMVADAKASAPAPAPAPSVDLDAAKRKLAAPATGTPSPSVSPKSNGGSKKARGGVDYVAIATHPSATLAPGKYTGMLVKHMSTDGLFRFLNADNVGPKGVGVTVEIDARSEKLMKRVRKITENSRIEMLVGTGYSRTGERMPMVLDVRQLDDVEKVTNVHKGTDVRGGRPTGPSDSIVNDARKARQGARRMAQMQRDAERISAAASGR